MIVIDGKNSILGRLSSFAAKKALKGEEIAIINCGEVRITGNRKNIEEKFKQSRSRVGTRQIGPKVHRSNEKIVKRSIRGMLPNYREGRGAIAFKRIRCYVGIPKELEKIKSISMFNEKKKKSITVKEIGKNE